ncbi:hypothetical protein SPRG_00635 [Saprolegnia parasitica CBS 223.65]|uniref:Ubiquitin-conjugating enzyme E2C-binding protein n=1 Tax=Saprolegnia parasitica (strain CBS 223.65) TaxID=695850 RepID=A0A067D6D8_SAPPC|nr:hypothetical protein SPRG_00635 [Saprolegnia parasitica CBS 223.65]KDO34572.1 hypothetical protein SPRG_00635 [Saprolegnia parasitica CBS 223.65]|eukprot:XP_012194249.1 hypothetical protein SPRG_00635 [Saprolegnia parasitica CBS 223.65]
MATKLSASELLQEMEDAKRAVTAAREQCELARSVVEEARADYAQANEARQACGHDVDALSSQLDATLAKVLHAPEFVIEFQANIGCYQCYVHIALEDATPTLVTNATKREIQLRVQDTTIFKATLAYAVDPKYSSVRVQKDHVHLRLPLTSAAKEDRKTAMTAGMAARTLSRAELDVRNYTELQCRCCGQVISNVNRPFNKVLPLPSSNWMEMVDFWGAAEGAFEHIPKDGIHAALDRVYVGQSDLLVHPDNIHAEMELHMASVRCLRCHTILGSQDEIGINLQKYLLQAKDVLDAYSSDSVIVTKLLEVIESEGLFRFDLVPSDADSPNQHLVLQVLSWDATIQTSGASAAQNVVKVLFTTTPTADDRLPTKELAFPSDLLETVTARLATSAELLPASLTGLNNLTLGFLFG